MVKATYADPSCLNLQFYQLSPPDGKGYQAAIRSFAVEPTRVLMDKATSAIPSCHNPLFSQLNTLRLSATGRAAAAAAAGADGAFRHLSGTL
jgi:hypothetical protein